jgi:uncharacterized RmlC-like cupin family protein
MDQDSIKHSRTGSGSPLVEVGEQHGNGAGLIQNLDVKGYVGVLHCNAGSRRSSHWHKTDSHYLYVLTGKMDYYWREVGDGGKPFHVEVNANQMVFTGPRVEHWTVFPRETVLISVSDILRSHEGHEADLVRVGWFR